MLAMSSTAHHLSVGDSHSLNLDLENSARPIGQQAPGILWSPPPQHWENGFHVASRVGAEGVSSSLGAYVASTYGQPSLRPCSSGS